MRKFKALIAVLTAAVLVFSLVGTAFAASAPSDVQGTKYEAAATKLMAYGISSGWGDGKFNPNGTVTRAQFSVLVVNELGLKAAAQAAQGTDTKFKDVKGSYWAAGYIQVATDKGIISGYGDGTFRPDNPITYMEAAILTVRALGYREADAADHLVKALTLGLMKNVNFKANDVAIRGELAIILDNMLGQQLGEVDQDGVWKPLEPATTPATKLQLQTVTGTVASYDVVNKKVTIDSTTYALGDNFYLLGAADLGSAIGAQVEATLQGATGAQKLTYIKITTPAPARFEVASVTATNLKQLTVKFNKPVDKASAETKANYKLDGVILGDSDTVALQPDGKTVVVTLNIAKAQQAVVKVDISGIKDTTGATVAAYSGNVTFLDTTVPAALSAAVTGPTKLQITFSEPVTATALSNAAFSIDNNTYSLAGTPAPVAGKPNVLEITLGTTLSAGNHTVTVNPAGVDANSTIKDFAGLNVPKTDLTFTYTVDTTAPTVSVKSATETSVTLKFSEGVTIPSSANILFRHTYDSSIYEVNAAHSGAVTAVGSSGDEYVINFGTQKPFPPGTVTLYIRYADPAGTKITDAWGNALAATSLTFAVTQDTTAPTVSSVALTQNDSNGAIIEVTFSEPVDVSGAVYSLKDAGGTGVTFTEGLTLKANTTATYTLKTNQLNGGSYTFAIKGVKDTSLAQNKMADYSTTLSVPDTVKPSVTSGVYVAGATAGTLRRAIVNFSEPMATSGAGSVLDVNNYQYSLDNGATYSPLPSGTTITLRSDAKSVLIAFPADQVVKAGNPYIQVAQVADLAGNKTASFSNIVKLDPDALTLDPAKANAKAISTDTITFEVQVRLSGIDVTKITVNGSPAVSASYVNQKVADGTVDGALVTVKAATKWATDLSDLNTTAVSIAAGGLTNELGTKNTAVLSIGNANVADKVAPAYKSIAASSNNAVTITFTESLDGSIVGLAKNDFQIVINGVAISPASSSASGAVLTLTLPSGTTFAAGDTVKVIPNASVNYVKDSKGNAYVPSAADQAGWTVQ